MKYPNEATLRNMTVTELFSLADRDDNPLVKHLMRAMDATLKEEIETLEAALAESREEAEAYSEMCDDKDDRILDIKRKLEELVNSGHPDELPEKLRELEQEL